MRDARLHALLLDCELEESGWVIDALGAAAEAAQAHGMFVVDLAPSVP
jgi:hypothetical protein